MLSVPIYPNRMVNSQDIEGTLRRTWHHARYRAPFGRSIHGKDCNPILYKFSACLRRKGGSLVDLKDVRKAHSLFIVAHKRFETLQVRYFLWILSPFLPCIDKFSGTCISTDLDMNRNAVDDAASSFYHGIKHDSRGRKRR